MNLVKSILDQLSGDALGKLSSAIGAEPSATRTAASAAVPAILSGLTAMASNRDGAKKLSNILGGLDLGGLGNLAGALTGDTGSLLQKGSGMLSSLLGEGPVAAIASAIGRFAGTSSESTKKLLAGLLPAVLGMVTSQWKSRGGTPEALSGLLSDQEENIAEAMPMGFSLDGIPGWERAASVMQSASSSLRMVGDQATGAARKGTRAAEQAASNTASWLVPLVAVPLALLALWYFWGRTPDENVAVKPEARTSTTTKNGTSDPVARTTLKPELPLKLDPTNLSAVKDQLQSVFTGAIGDLSKVKDAASAAAALPSLEALGMKVDSIREVIDRMPQTGQTAIGDMVGDKISGLKEQAERVLAIPGVGEQLRGVLNNLTSKLSGLNMAGVTKDATELLASLTTSLGKIKDRASAQEAIPQLEQISEKIDSIARTKETMSKGGQTMLAQAVSAVRAKLTDLVSSVLSTLGADAGSVKTVLDTILNKVAALASPPTPS